MLTARQEQVLKILKNFIDNHGKAPSLSELQEALDIKWKRAVVKHLEALQKKGFISRTSEPRGITILNENIDSPFLSIPILGYANAGRPLHTAKEEKIGSIEVDKKLVPGKEGLFSVIVKGDSMNLQEVNGGLLKNGNYAVVKKNGFNSESSQNKAVLAIVNDEATIKIFQKGKDKVILKPNSNNSIHTPIYIHEDTPIHIAGEVVVALEN